MKGKFFSIGCQQKEIIKVKKTEEAFLLEGKGIKRVATSSWWKSVRKKVGVFGGREFNMPRECFGGKKSKTCKGEEASCRTTKTALPDRE